MRVSERYLIQSNLLIIRAVLSLPRALVAAIALRRRGQQEDCGLCARQDVSG